MTRHRQQDSGESGGSRARRGDGATGEGVRRRRGEGDGDERRVVDESVPVAEGLTSPGEGMDDEPAEPRQSKDYA